MAKNYYAILGVLPTATFEEIKSAYRKGAKRYHPDHFGRDSAAFMNIQEAYEVLSDPSNRASYDRKRRSAATGTEHRPEYAPEPLRPRRSARNKPGQADLGTISPLHSFRTFRPSFEEVFDYLQNALDIRAERKAEGFQTLSMEVVLTPGEAGSGGRIRILLPIEAACATCGGSGETGLWQCWRCDGTGVIRGEFPLEVEYPPGIRDSYEVAIPLDRFGVHDICLVLLFRISSEGEIETL